MKTSSRSFRRFLQVGLGAVLCLWAGAAQSATLFISPASISNSYTGDITLDIGALGAGASIGVHQYVDANTNGVIDAADWLVFGFTVTDNAPETIGGQVNANVPNDSNSTSGVVRVRTSFLRAGAGQTVAGRHLFRLYSPTSAFSPVTNTFTITQTAYGQRFTGKVQIGGTNQPFAGVLVLVPDEGPVGMAVTDASGTYSIPVPVGSYQVYAFKSNGVLNASTVPTLALGAGATVTTNVNLLSATRTLSGKVHKSGDVSVGLPGLLIVASSDDNHFLLGFTDAGGNFSLRVTPGLWEVGGDDVQIAQYGYVLPDSLPVADTTSGNVTGFNAPLPKGTALVYGTVRDSGASPIAGARMEAYDDSNLYESYAISAADGTYSLAVLAGGWQLEAESDPYVFPNYHRTLAGGEALMLDFTGVVGARVSGKVMGGGVPQEGISVQVGTLTWDQYGNWNWSGNSYYADTDSNGDYSMLVPSGTSYYARVQSGGLWVSQFYNQVTDVEAATRFSALVGAPATNINFFLQVAARITGTVTGPNGSTPLQNIEATAYRQNGTDWDWIEQDQTDALGQYSIGGLPAGTYRVEFDDPNGLYVTEVYNNAPDKDSGTDITVIAGGTAGGINASLAVAGRISGRVTQLNGTTPIEDIQATAYVWNPGGWWEWVEAGQTDSNGDYTIEGLAPANYRVEFKDWNNGVYATEVYNNAPDLDSGTNVSVTAAATTSGINASLSTGAEISGTVTAPNGTTPLENIQATAYRWDGGSWDWFDQDQTDALGQYAISGLPAGTYLVEFSDSNQDNYVTEWFENVSSQGSASNLVLSAGTNLGGINASLTLASHISGIVTGPDGTTPLEDVQATAYQWNGGGWDWIEADQTDTNGNYNIGRLAAGTYRVQFDDFSDNVFTTEVYNNVANLDNGDNIPVATGATVSGISASLSATGPFLTYNAQGGSSPVPAYKVLTNGSPYGVLATTARGGFTFGGWWTGSGGSGSEVTAATTVAGTTNHMLYAKWIGASVTVTFDAQAGTTPVPTSKVVSGGSAYGALATTARSGFTFSGWWTGSGGTGTEVTSATTVVVTTNHTLYAKWAAATYTVFFDSQSGSAPSPASKSVVYGSAYGTLAGTTRAGYTFAGWWTGAGGTGTEVTAASTVTATSDQTLFAKWTAVSYTATFDAQGGTAPSPASKSVTYGAAYGTLATTTRAGYTLGGWWTGAGGTGTEVTAATTVSATGNHTLYAKWLAPVLTVTPASQRVGYLAGTTTFAVTNTGNQPMSYAANETETWLSIAGGGSGGNSGTLTIGFDGNAGMSSRTGTVTVTAAGAVNSPVTLLVVQSAMSGCGDYNGDGQTDMAVFDIAGGYWYTRTLSGGVVSWADQWGWSTAWPVVGDYNGDGVWDQAVFDTQGGYWYIKTLTGSVISWANQWGWSTAKPVPGDYNGDGVWDQAVFDTAGGYWYIKTLAGGVIAWADQWGWSTAKPIPGDYNGDGTWDQAIFDTAGGYWYIKTVTGAVIRWADQWGWSTAKPVPGDYDGDGTFDQAVFDTAGGYWYIKRLNGTVITWANQWGWSTAKPVSGDFDGDGVYDLAVYDTAQNLWYIKSLDGRVLTWAVQWGFPGCRRPTLGD